MSTRLTGQVDCIESRSVGGVARVRGSTPRDTGCAVLADPDDARWQLAAGYEHPERLCPASSSFHVARRGVRADRAVAAVLEDCG